MAAKKKRLARFVDAVSDILGNGKSAKKLRKAEALERFLAKLEDKQSEIARDLSKGRVKGKDADKKKKQAHLLEKQIKKGRKLLADMR